LKEIKVNKELKLEVLKASGLLVQINFSKSLFSLMSNFSKSLLGAEHEYKAIKEAQTKNKK
jgi:hypothetical protein